MQTNDLTVIHDAQRKRFEIHVEPFTAELTYSMNGDTIIFLHTGVPTALEGRGIGSLLVKAGLEYVRKNSLKVQTLCWFVDKYMQRHPNE